MVLGIETDEPEARKVDVLNLCPLILLLVLLLMIAYCDLKIHSFSDFQRIL